MIGQEPTISEIVLTEQPNVIDLRCHEQMPPEEEEQDLREAYRVSAECGLCKRTVRFICLSDREDIRVLQQLLFSLNLLCLTCVKANHLNYGG